MPELPEVETVRRLLSSQLTGQTITAVDFLWPKTAATGVDLTVAGLVNEQISAIDRRGKFLLFRLTNAKNLVVHLRMEGKLYIYEPGQWTAGKFDRAVMTFNSGCQLVFADVRKFGRWWFYEADQPVACLNHLGPEAPELTSEYLLTVLKKEHRPLKEVLLDQSLMAGIGNIYADEIGFAAGLNPFVGANAVATMDNAEKIVNAAKHILQTAIDLGGSSVRTYQASATAKGHYQERLMVYGRHGLPCKNCQTPIMKRALGGRGTSYCPHCQKVGTVIGLTGRIAAGKTTTRNLLAEYGYHGIDTDSLINQLYQDKQVQKELVQIEPQAFQENGMLNRDLIRDKLTNDAGFRRRWLGILYPLLKMRIEKMLNDEPTVDFALEAPLLFKARLDSLCSQIFLLKTNEALKRLEERGVADPQAMLALSQTNNDWTTHLAQVTAIIDTDKSAAELKKRLTELLK